MSYHLDDTIAAVATAPGGAARGIVRLSGEHVGDCLQGIFEPRGCVDWESVQTPQAIAGSLRLVGLASTVPCNVYLWPGRRSYTRQPVAELHTLGSPPLLQMVLRSVCAAGARLAEPGEFTLRAFLAGRIDLAQAEAVLGVIDARDATQLRVALAQLAGGMSRPLHAVREALLNLLAHLEAGLDFAEEDLEFISRAELQQQLATARDQIHASLAQLAARDHARSAARVVLVGWPNVGKSSLFNALAQKSSALISSEPGTTRDYLVAPQRWQEVSWDLVDTAGVEPADVPQSLAAAAQSLAAGQHDRADVQLLCLDASRPLNDWERQQLAAQPAAVRLVVLSKSDVPRRIELTQGADMPQKLLVATSSLTGQGLDALRDRIAMLVAECHRSPCGAVLGTAIRCQESLRLAAEALERAWQLVAHRGGDELVAIEVRAALDALGRVVGAVFTDDILDRVFSRFCIGK